MILYTPLRRLWNSSQLFNALIELNSYCNLRCTHCFNYEKIRKKVFLDSDILLESLKKLKEKGLLYITFTGGEPLLHPDFKRILKETSEMEFILRIYSNLLSLTEDILYLLSSIRVYEVETSIYGAKPETHDFITGKKDSFAITLRNARKLLAKDIRVNLKMLINKYNFREYEPLKNMAEREGFGFIASEVVIPCEGERTKGELQLDEKELAEFYLSFPEFRQKKRERKIPLCNVEKAIYISPEGFVKRCLEHPTVIANIYEEDILEVVESNFFRESANIAKEFPKGKCKDCDLINFCSLCPALILNPVSGDNAHKRFCKIAKVRRDVSVFQNCGRFHNI